MLNGSRAAEPGQTYISAHNSTPGSVSGGGVNGRESECPETLSEQGHQDFELDFSVGGGRGDAQEAYPGFCATARQEAAVSDSELAENCLPRGWDIDPCFADFEAWTRSTGGVRDEGGDTFEGPLLEEAHLPRARSAVWRGRRWIARMAEGCLVRTEPVPGRSDVVLGVVQARRIGQDEVCEVAVVLPRCIEVGVRSDPGYGEPGLQGWSQEDLRLRSVPSETYVFGRGGTLFSVGGHQERAHHEQQVRDRGDDVRATSCAGICEHASGRVAVQHGPVGGDAAGVGAGAGGPASTAGTFDASRWESDFFG